MALEVCDVRFRRKVFPSDLVRPKMGLRERLGALAAGSSSQVRGEAQRLADPPVLSRGAGPASFHQGSCAACLFLRS